MANSLRRTIKSDEIVIVSVKHLEEDSLVDPTDVNERAFKCLGGLGMKITGEGHTILGEWLVDGTRDSIKGFMIDVTETEQLERNQNNA